MTAYFNQTGWPEKAPSGDADRKDFVASLHKQKTELFMALIEKKLLPLRPGVAKYVTWIYIMIEHFPVFGPMMFHGLLYIVQKTQD